MCTHANAASHVHSSCRTPLFGRERKREKERERKRKQHVCSPPFAVVGVEGPGHKHGLLQPEELASVGGLPSLDVLSHAFQGEGDQRVYLLLASSKLGRSELARSGNEESLPEGLFALVRRSAAGTKRAIDK